MDLNLFTMLMMLALFWGLLLAARLSLSFIHLMAAILTLNLIGLYMQGLQNHSFLPMHIFGFGLVAFAAGVSGGRLIHPQQYGQWVARMDVSSVRQRNESLVILIVGVPVLVLGVMLFVLKGIPLFSSNAELYRFTIAEGAGPFWRMQQFGIPMVALIAGVYLRGAKKPLNVIKILFFVFFTATIATSVLRGHKAGILYGLLWFVVLMLVTNRRRTVPKRWMASFLGVLALSFGVMVLVTQQIMHMNTQEALGLLVERATLIEAMGFYNLVEYYVPAVGFQYGLAQWPSFLGLLATFRLRPHIDIEESSFGVVLARYFEGEANFVGWVITPFGDFYADFGVLGVVIGGVLLGLFAEWLYHRALKAPPSLRKAVFIALQAQMVQYATAGSLLAIISNHVVSFLVVAVAYYLVYRFLQTFFFKTSYVTSEEAADAKSSETHP